MRTIIFLALAGSAVLSALVAGRTPVAQTHRTQPSPAGFVAVCATPPAGMVSWWPAESNGHDIVSHFNLLLGGAGFAIGEVGNAFSFNGTNFATPGNVAGLNFAGTAHVTIDGWINPSAAGGQGILFGKAVSGQGQYWLYMNGGEVEGALYLNSGGVGISSLTSPPANTWTHVALTYDGEDTNTLAIYINGALANSIPLSGNLAECNQGPCTPSQRQFTIGGRDDGFDFTGLIDEVEVFNTTVSATDISNIYLAGSLGKCRTCYAPPPNMIGWWPGDGNTKDIQSGNNGLLKNGATFGTGEVNQAFSFDGVSAAVEVPDDPAWNLGSNDFTIDTWVKFNGFNGRDPLVAHDEGAGPTSKWIFWLDSIDHSGTPTLELFTFSPAGGPNLMGVPFTPVTGQWYHVAVTRSGATYKIYVDGAQVGSDQTNSAAVPDASAPLTLGFAESDIALNGFLDEVEIFNRALTADEIQSIYDAGSQGKCKPTCIAPPSGLIGWWPGDNTAIDIQSGHNGTLQNGATFANGKVDRAFNFDGSNDFVSVPHSAGLDPNPSFSVDFWVFRRGVINPSGNFEGLVVQSQGDGSDSYSIFTNESANDLFVVVGGASFITNSGGEPPLNQWTHIALTYDDSTGTANVYINGQLDTSINGLSRTISTGPLTFGTRDGEPLYLNGLLDEIEVFSHALTPGEVAAIYNAGSAGKCKTVRFYVSNNSNATIEKFDINGVDLGTFAVTLSGNGSPTGLAFDASGNLFVSDQTSNIFEFDPLGNGTVFADSSSGLASPYGLAFDASGNLYVANALFSNILKFQPNGSVTTFASSGLHSPTDVVFDRDGNLYAVNDQNGTIEKYLPNGTDQGVFASATLQSPIGARFDEGGQLYVSDFLNNHIEKFDSSGNDLGAFASVGGSGFWGMEFDPFGNLYVAFYNNSRIYKFDQNANQTTFASFPHLNGPEFIAVQLFSPTATSIQFNKPSYSVNEAAGTITLTVTRNGDLSGTSTVHYATADGAGPSGAVSPDDYTATSGDFTFNPTETSMTFQVPIIVDDDSDPGSEPSSKTFTATLSNVTGGMLGGPATGTVTINDIHYTISVAVSGTNQGGGTTSGEGGTVSGAGTYDSGATVDLVATPNDCFTFTSWTEGNTIVSTDPHLTFTASTGRNLVANFAIKAGCAGACNSFASATIADVSSEYDSNRLAVHVVDGIGLDSNDPPNHDTEPTHMWMNGGDGNVGSSGADPDYPAQLGHITFNLNGTFSVSSFRVWNYNENTNFAYSNRGVNTLKISTSIDGVNFTPQINPATNTAIWTFDAAPTDPSYTGQVITFPTPLTAAYVRFDILTNHGVDPQDSVDHRFVGLSEIRFNMCPVSCVPPPANMTAWWKGDGNANDSVGGHDGSLMNGATFGAGEVGQGFSFNGAGAFVSVPGPVANFGTGDFTIDFWMQTSSTSGTREILNKRVCGDAPDAFEVRIGDTILVELLRNNDGTGSNMTSTRVYNDGQFHHIAIVRSGNTLSIYGDGTLDNFITDPNVGATNINNNLPLGIAGGGCADPNSGDGTATFLGVLDEIELFNRALSPDEIAGIVRAGGLGKCECTPPPAGMVSWWPGEGNGDDIQDGNNATINNILFAAGEVGQAFVFDGSTSDINVPASSNLDVGAGGGMTIDMWINPEAAAITAAVSPILAEWNAGSGGDEAIGTGLILDRDYGNNLSAGALEFEIVDTLGNGCALGTGPGAIVAGRWQHVAATYDKTSGQTVLYVNGQVVASGACGSLTLQTSYPLDFGIRRGGSGGARYTGAMDEMEVFNRALSASEIAAIYHAGSAGKCRPCTPPPTGMVSWWPGDGNPFDIHGSNNGTLQNGATFAPGNVGNAFSFNGTNYVEVADSSSLSITGPMTIDAWINANNDTGSEHAIVEKYDGGGTDGYFFRLDPTGRLVAGICNASTISTVTGNTLVTTGTFHHVAAVFDGTNLMVYLDGNLDGGPAASVAPTDGVNPLEIGARGGSPFNFFDGLIDEVEIFNVALDPSEIAAIYDAGSGGKCKPAGPPLRQLANISSRADVGSGNNVAIAGFIVQTDSATTSSVRTPPGPNKRVLIRGIGSSLTGFGAQRLANPVLDLYDSQGTKIDHNDNWMEEPDGTHNSARTAAIQATGIAPSDPNEAALLETLASDNTYTAILSGKSGGTGIGLVEVYDLEATTNTHTHNLSTRALVSTGNNVLIGGLIVEGDTTTRVLLRAIGPSLSGSGIPNPLPDPVLELYDANANLMERNDDWADAPNAGDIPIGFAPGNSKESAILFAPAPGIYTAIIHDKNNANGIGLFESYWLGP